MSSAGIWYKCKGCGKPIGFFPDGFKSPKGNLPRGAVAHAKPDHLMGIPNSVPCNLFRRLGPVELYLLHQDAEKMEDAEDMTPFLG
jgi:hypothetical protein